MKNSTKQFTIFVTSLDCAEKRRRKWQKEMVIDYRKLNDKTIEDKYPLPRMKEILENLGKCSYFTTLDLTQGFHQIPVDKNSIEETAFTVENGHYEMFVCHLVCKMRLLHSKE